jgi:CRP-like cAMP-binding protein
MLTSIATPQAPARTAATSRAWVERALPPASGRPLVEALELTGVAMSFARNEEIYGEDEPAEFVYLVKAGAVRTYKLLNDGRRQIGGFHLSGDIFGLEAGARHRFTAEAISDAQVVVVKRNALVALAARKPEFARELWTLTANELAHVQELMLTLGRKTAQERVAAFLLEMAGRSSVADAIELPMSRQDIADYLGLTIETVSRTLTQLENSHAIELPTSRRIVLRDKATLNRLNA